MNNALEKARTELIRAAIHWRNHQSDKTEIKLCEAVDYYEDVLFAEQQSEEKP